MGLQGGNITRATVFITQPNVTSMQTVISLHHVSYTVEANSISTYFQYSVATHQVDMEVL